MTNNEIKKRAAAILADKYCGMSWIATLQPLANGEISNPAEAAETVKYYGKRLRECKFRTNAQRLNSLIRESITRISYHHNLLDSDLETLEDCFYLTKPVKAGAWYEVNAILGCLTRLLPLNPNDGGRQAKLIAEVENFADSVGIKPYDETKGFEFDYLRFSSYVKTRKFRGEK